jgi:4-aminobutyrate aminotransferase-like enzyme
LARAEIADAMKGVTISTFGGNPVATTAAKAVIDFIEEQNLAINAAEVGAHLRGRLEELKEKHALIGDVRGMGLLQAIELVEDRKTKKPATAETLALMESAREQGLLIGRGGMYGNVLRISPPMNIGKSDVDEFARILDSCLVRSQAVAV